MRLLTALALAITVLAGGVATDASARDRDRERDRKQERYERAERQDRQERRQDDRRHDERRFVERRYEERRYDGGRRDEARRDENRYLGGREASLVDRRSAPEGRSASRMTAGQAARQAQQRYGGGRVLSVDSMGDGYRVKLLRDGDVRVVFISDP